MMPCCVYRKAIALDPEFASAYGMAAWCLFSRSLNGRMEDPEQEIAEGTRLARCAVDLGKSDAVALARGGHALAHFSRDLDTGIDFLDRALVLNPNLAAAWFLGGDSRLPEASPRKPSGLRTRHTLEPARFRRCFECRPEWRWRI